MLTFFELKNSLNFPDLLVIRGLYQFKPEPPFVPGAESAGVIVD